MKKNIMPEIRSQFESLRAEVGGYNPEAFERIERRFFELSKVKVFKAACIEDPYKAGKCPAEEWLKANGYPVTEGEVEVVRFVNKLSEKSAREFLSLMHRFIMKSENSKAFQSSCRKLNQSGINNVALWLGKNNFEPVFKKEMI